MKGNGIERDTLDGVITALERVDDTWQNGRNGLQYADLRDAIHYLKEYQRLQIAFLKALADLEDNPPISWEELRQMAGKPVWVEGEHGFIWNHRSWVLIDPYDENDDLIICHGTDTGHYEFAICKEDYGTDWQAYRKER